MANGRLWTAREKARLRELHKGGMTIRECAAAIGRTQRACAAKLYIHKRQFCRVKQRGVKLTEEQIQWIVDNYAETTNYHIEKATGLSCTRLHDLARERGLRKSDEFMHKTALRASAAAKESHLDNGTYKRKGTKPNHNKGFQKGETNLQRLGPEAEERRKANAIAALAARRKEERRRLSIGLPQKTKLKIVSEGRKVWCYRYRLKKKGYRADPDDPKLMRLPLDLSMRSVRMEQSAAKYGFRFDTPESLGKVDPSKLDLSAIAKTFSEEKVFTPEKKTDIPDDLYGISRRCISDLRGYANDKSVIY